MEMAKLAPLEVTMPRQLPAEGRSGGKKALAGSAVALVLCLGFVASNTSRPEIEVHPHPIPTR